MWRLFLSISSILILLCSCSNDETSDAFLQQPPFDKLTDSIKSDPHNADLYYRRGVLLFDNNQVAYAEQDVKKAWSITPKEEYAMGVADVLAKKNEDSAIVFLQNATNKLPQSIALQIALATHLHQKGDNEKALAVCNEITAQHPNQIDALVLQSQILKDENKNPEAIAVLEKAYSYAPFDVQLVYDLAFAYAEAKNPKVLALTDSLLKMDTSGRHAEPYYFKGIYFSNSGNKDMAIKNFDAAIEHDYYFMNAYINKGIVYYDQKNYPAALKVFQLASTISPSFADAYFWTAKCQQAMNDKANAKLNYQRAYGLDKSLTEAKQAADQL